MTNNIIPLFVKHDSVEETIKSALDVGYKEALIIGFDEEGLIRYRSSFSDLRHEIAALELVKQHMINTELFGYDN